MNLIEEALIFAAVAHAGQIRKYTGEPYVFHPIAVARTISEIKESNNEMIIAALLHDVVEDTSTTIETIEHKFGVVVAIMVIELTDISVSTDGNREARKEIDLLHTAQVSRSSKTIKLADMIDNLYSVTKFDPIYAPIYARQKNRLLSVLTDSNFVLLAEAKDAINKIL